MSPTTPVRQLVATAGAAAAAVVLAVTPTAQASAQSTGDDKGLYGVQDPTYDGVFRQALTLIALDAAGRQPARQAVAWLTGQQCDDGGWMSYRADTAKPCTPKLEDTNATAMAVQALVAIGGPQADTAADRGVRWLRSVRNADGGVGYNPGGATDANSTGLLANALHATGTDPASARNAEGHTPLDALLDLRVGCGAPPRQQGAFAYQPERSGVLLANDSATAAALLALAGGHLPVTKPADPVAASPGPCRSGEGTVDGAVSGAASYLSARLRANESTIPPLQGKEPDYFTTANTVLALVAAGEQQSAEPGARALAGNVDPYVGADDGGDQPAALASLVLVAEATGQDPSDFGGQDVAARLADTGPPAPVREGDAAGGGSTGADGGQEALADTSTLMSVGSVLAAAAAVAVGIGLYRRGTYRRRGGS